VSPEEYLQQASAAIEERYSGDCLQQAKKILAIFVAEGREAWIGRLRKTEKRGDTTMHWPLIPLRFRGRSAPTWTTHYVCCSGELAYDPLVGHPIPLSEFSRAVFGEEIEIVRV
jgi:hypothetical protein